MPAVSSTLGHLSGHTLGDLSDSDGLEDLGRALSPMTSPFDGNLEGEIRSHQDHPG